MSNKGISRRESCVISSLRFDIPIPQFETPLQQATSELTPIEKNKENHRAQDLISKNSPPFPVIPYRGNIPHISSETMIKILSKKYKSYYDSFIIIDCRFPYEYRDGHIKGAINSNDPEELKAKFFDNVKEKILIIFHCEFSQNRGPEVASIFREFDRKINEECYPKLIYPDVYVLHGGYSEFYKKHKDWCEGGYTKMLNSQARSNGELVKSNSDYNNNIKKAKDFLSIKETKRLGDEKPKIKRSNSCFNGNTLFSDPVSPLIIRTQPRFNSTKVHETIL